MLKAPVYGRASDQNVSRDTRVLLGQSGIRGPQLAAVVTLCRRDVNRVGHAGARIGAELCRTNENVFPQLDAIELRKQVLVMIVESIVLVAQRLDQALHHNQRRDTKQLIR